MQLQGATVFWPEERRFRQSLWLALLLHVAVFAVLGAMQLKASREFPFRIVDIRLAEHLQRQITSSIASAPPPAALPASKERQALNPQVPPAPVPLEQVIAPKRPQAKTAPEQATTATPQPKARPQRAEDSVPLWQKEEVWRRTRSKQEKYRPVARSLEEYVNHGDVLDRIARIAPESDEAVRLRYTQVLSLWLYKFRDYPEAAKEAGLQGKALVRLRIDRSGRVLFFQIDQSTGHPVLDQAIRDTVFRASPLPEVPAHFPGGSQLEFVMAMYFVPD